MARAGIRPHQEKQIGKARHGDALVGFGPVGPGRVQVVATQPLDRKRRRPRGHLEAGGTDDGIDLDLAPVFGDDAVLGNPRRAVGNQLGVVGLDRRIPVVGNQDALAADCIVRGHRFA